MSAAPRLSPDQQRRLQGLFASERDVLAKRLADAPALWFSIPTWGRVFTTGRRLLGLDRTGRR